MSRPAAVVVVVLLLLRLLAIAVLSSAFSTSMGPRSMTGVGVVGRREDVTARTRTTRQRRRRRRRHLHSLDSENENENENYDDYEDDYDDEEGGGGSMSLPPLVTSATTRDLGERLILDAACDCGATERMVNVEWRGDRIVVTVDVYADKDYDDDDYDDDDDDDGDDEGGDYDEQDWDGDDGDDGVDGVVGRNDSDDGLDVDEVDIDYFDDPGEGSNDDVDVDAVGRGKRRGVDLTRIARAINEAFARDAPDGPGYAVAMTHEIEVTTPVFDGVLRGRRMFDSYRGFDVIVEHFDGVKRAGKENKNGKKSASGGRKGGGDDVLCVDDGLVGEATKSDNDEQRKIKMTHGKLVGRDYQGVDGDGVTTINVKGRAVRIRNDDILSVSLPKAKREKGVK
ncbi:hypothetical protein ACHAXA_002450 [Cyclostephanos tholiformis]|uniref:Uncharacterized protein n=1 Tax=Cyclostephanos tholiformis TaxID=382380 RepID=A0ABD3RFP8_9STRA